MSRQSWFSGLDLLIVMKGNEVALVIRQAGGDGQWPLGEVMMINLLRGAGRFVLGKCS